ncbi:DUF3106 domain-containing protein [Terriglobus roseus]|uniref:DUF3106 domain-containing protein n=1 Tax=Terriglobus roseus TaxID=392734 RepID=A0A1G7KXX1_9BACT|nr:DUF3106 domain-containing protein [Terriglobus roseus]SDF42098.1 Protein of unknown function [Terriglobus roseus]
MNSRFSITTFKLRQTAAAALFVALGMTCMAQGNRNRNAQGGGVPHQPNFGGGGGHVPNYGGGAPHAPNYGGGSNVRPAMPQGGQQQINGRPGGNGFAGQSGQGAVIGPQRPRGEHLDQWMQQHQNLSPQQQQRALQKEPGFNQLPQQTQQRMTERLNRLNSMSPQQREKVIQRGEAMERLSPQQRVQVRGAMGQLSALPEDRRRAVARSFRELRAMPPEQQNQMLNSPQYHQQFSDQERGTLGNLLSVSPMLPQNQ